MLRAQTRKASHWTPMIIIALALLALYYLWNILVIFIISAFLAFVLHPLIELLDHWLPRIVAILLVYLVLAVIFAVAGILLVPLIMYQFNGFLSSLPQFVAEGKDLFDSLHTRYFALPDAGQSVVDRTLEQVQALAGTVARQAIPAAIQLITRLASLLIVPVLTFFILLDYRGYGRMILTLTPKRSRRSVTDLLKRLDEALWAFIRGESLLMLSVGLATSLGLYLVGMPYPVVFGVLAGLLEVIPNLGPTVTFIVVTLVALAISPVLALKAGSVAIVVQLLENSVLVPVVMATTVKLDPVTVALAVVIGGSLAGPLGVLVAIPLAVAIKVVLLHFYAHGSDAAQSMSRRRARRGSGNGG